MRNAQPPIYKGIPTHRSPVVTVFKKAVSLVRNGYFWKGTGILIAVAAIIYVTINSFLLPLYTRHGVAIPVPDVMSLSFEQASDSIEEAGLVPEEIILRKPNLPRNVVIDQNPKAGWTVKPGRRIYLTVNSGDTTTVIVPKIEAISVREARNRIMIHGLVVADVQPDSIPSLHANTVTRQEPEAGKRVDPGTPVSIWYSTGLGQNSVLVPEVTGMRADSARAFLLGMRLRSVLLGGGSEELEVIGQSPDPGTSVREGSEIRLRVEVLEQEDPGG